QIEQFIGDGRRQAKPACRVLRVGDDQVHLVPFHQMPQMIVHDFAPGTAENIADEKYPHDQSLILPPATQPSLRRYTVTGPAPRWPENRNWRKGSCADSSPGASAPPRCRNTRG